MSCLESQSHGRLVPYFGDVGFNLPPIIVTAIITTPPLSSIGALYQCGATNVQVIAEFWLGTSN